MAAPATDAKGPLLRVSPGFTEWLASSDCSLALSTYQAGRLIMIGRRANGALRAHERLLEQCQGLWTDGRTLWVSGRHALWRFRNDVPEGRVTETGADRRFVPREGRVIGAVDVHDIGMGDPGQFGAAGEIGPIFVNTAFNCLASISEDASFRALWRPPFISALIGEDRCHLNGLAMDGTRAAYVTAVGRADNVGGWRDHRRDGGLVIDVATTETVATGLSMPHSPRLHDGRLWVLDSGRGALCVIDPADGARTEVAFCPGFARGLAFVGRHAVIGLSRPRHGGAFDGLEIDARLTREGAAAFCGVMIVDTVTGQTAATLGFEHTIDELYDVGVLRGVREPEAVGFMGPEIETRVQIEA
jgi:uncharacterized protein (TIGR03032 family)